MEEAAARFRPLFRCFCQLVASPFSPDARRAFHLVIVPRRFLPFPATTLQLMPSPFSVIASHSSARRYLGKAMLRVATCTGADVWLHRPSFFRLSYFFSGSALPPTFASYFFFFDPSLCLFSFCSSSALFNISSFFAPSFFLALPSYFLLRRFGNTRPIFYPFPTSFPFLYPPPCRLLPFDTLLYSSIGRPNDRPGGWLSRPPSRIVRPIRSIISPRCSRKYCLLSFVFYFDPEIGAATLKRAYGLAFSLLCPGQLRPEWKRAKVLQSAMN